jgi:predicted GTPase
MAKRRVVILGAGGRDFHDFNVLFKDDPDTEVVAFTASQIPGIDHRVYPPSLAGAQYPEGIAIVPEDDLARIVVGHHVNEVVLAYSDLSHEEVMHKASRVLALGADFRLVAPAVTALESRKPVIAVCAVRTGAGKSQTSRHVAGLLKQAGLSVALVRHPMPYGDLEAMRCQRFATLEDIDRAHPTIEEREEYEEPVRRGVVVYAGVDYAEVLRAAQGEADVILWDGGNNDTPFFATDIQITVADALRPGHELTYHPGELNVLLADIVVVNKVDSAEEADVRRVEENVHHLNPSAAVVRADSPVTLDPGPSLEGARVLVVEDGPTLTHGGMTFGAGTVAARAAGAELVDPRPFAVGSIREVYERFGSIGPVLPAMGYSDAQVHELEETIAAVDCDAVVCATPFDLARLVRVSRPMRRTRYEFRDAGEPTLAQLLGPAIDRWTSKAHLSTA